MRKLSNLGAIFVLTTLLAACGSISLNGKYTARTNDHSIEMDFNEDANLLTLKDGQHETISEYTIKEGQLLLNDKPTYTIVETNANTYELYRIQEDGTISDEVSYTLQKK
ncbi:hypothetical protein WDR10_02255 [Kurthia gibsonii]|uniref:hypothetical protein n=1 Tax=Kurthia gibsonii TaxID=33946 RepID=UPI0030D5098C